MSESKIDATDRLRREGRLEAFNLRRDEIRNELRDAGKKRQEARDKAWSRAIEEFSPLTDEPKTPEAEVAVEDDFPDLAIDEDASDIVADAKWVYHHLSHKSAKAEDAPSAGAWSMLQWARHDPKQFFQSVAIKLLHQDTANANEEALVAAEEKSIDQLRARLEQIVQESKQSCRREDLARCSDQEIQAECERRAIACNGQPK